MKFHNTGEEKRYQESKQITYKRLKFRVASDFSLANLEAKREMPSQFWGK